MIQYLFEYYLIIKSLHIVSVISWMAGLLYLPRLFVYHSQTSIGSEASEQFKVMEQRLFKYIMNPALIATLVFGTLVLVANGSIDWSAWWLQVKLIGVIALVVCHCFFGLCVVEFRNDRNRKSERFFRFTNEIPTGLMVLIVFLVVIKPGS
ncbi:MAG: protoporphyrinogen oxidase HemJ [Rhodospirillaceae bacterium]|jgi:putative membrane protein